MMPLAFALLQTPPAQPQNTGTMWVLTQGIMVFARKINAAMSPSTIGGGFLDFLFYIAVAAMILSLGYEVSMAVRKGFGDGHGVLSTLLDGAIMKKALRLGVFFFLGGVTYMFINVDTGRGIGPFESLTDMQQVRFVEQVLYPLAGDPSGTGPDAPISKLGEIATNLKAASNTFGAWNIVKTTQMETAKKQAGEAAVAFWDNLNPEDKGMTDGSGTTSPNDEQGLTEMVKEGWQKIVELAQGAFGMAKVYAVAFGLFVMNFGLDVYATRVIMLNGLFLAMAYKLVFIFLPIACVLAYFPSMTGLLVGCIRSLVVCIISLNVLCSATATLMSPSGIQQIAQAASTSGDTNANGTMDLYVKKVYTQMAIRQPGFSKEAFVTAAKDGLSDTVNMYYLNAEAVLWAPVRVMMAMGLMIAFLGKIGVVISDSINGSMSFHRG